MQTGSHITNTALGFMSGAIRIACSAMLFMILVAGGIYLGSILLTGLFQLISSF